jgi:hypothetical protein
MQYEWEKKGMHTALMGKERRKETTRGIILK